MYQINSYEKHSLTMYHLADPESNCWLTVCPERGGIITNFGVQGKEKLYVEEDTLYNRDTSVRGGIPILFPISGRLTDQKYEWNGESYSMPMHGFARDLPWEVVDTEQPENNASITIKLVSNAQTKKYYPFDFSIAFTYTLSKENLVIDQIYHNYSEQSMPIYVGFHPYFNTPITEESFTIDCDATKYLYCKDNSVKDFEGTVIREDLFDSIILLDATEKMIKSKVDSNQVIIKTDSIFPYTVLWSQSEKEFICIEPWMAMPDELNRKKELQYVDADTPLQTSISIHTK